MIFSKTTSDRTCCESDAGATEESYRDLGLNLATVAFIKTVLCFFDISKDLQVICKGFALVQALFSYDKNINLMKIQGGAVCVMDL